jgi:hypothetical protein
MKNLRFGGETIDLNFEVQHLAKMGSAFSGRGFSI